VHLLKQLEIPTKQKRRNAIRALLDSRLWNPANLVAGLADSRVELRLLEVQEELAPKA
jgi:hypothetical protein